MTRDVTLVLVDSAGSILGSLPTFTVDGDWWPEVADIVATARSTSNLDLAVLRVLGPADRPGPPGGRVAYAGEVSTGSALPPLSPVPTGFESALAPHPRRAPWAEPAGPAATVAWARAAMTTLGRPPTTVTQHKTWNLSGVWRLDSADGPAWIKQVPAFFAHEPAVLGWLATAMPGVAPQLLAHDGARMVLEHAAGEDRSDAQPAELALMLTDLLRVQTHATTRVDELLALGVPDRRAPMAIASIAATAELYGPRLPAQISSTLRALVDRLPERLAAVADCGVPDTLVHGDFDGSNVRASDTSRTIMDWGDTTIGHRAMDLWRLTEDLAPDNAAPLIDAWARSWRAHTPGCDPKRAFELLRPVIALQYAAVYVGFLDHIEPSEWPYHATDVPDYLNMAVELDRH